MRSIVRDLVIVLFCCVPTACTTYIPDSASTARPVEALQPRPSASPAPFETLHQASPTPTPIPESAFIPDIDAVFRMDFSIEEEIPDTWSASNTVFENGAAIINANEGWQGIYTGYRWTSGETLLWRFRYAAGSQANISISAGEWDTASFRQWGILSDYGQITPHLWEGDRYLLLGWEEGFMQLESDYWYVLMIHIGGHDEPFVVRVWDEEAPEDIMETRMTFGYPGWDNLQWNASATTGPIGTLAINYFEVVQGLP